MTFIICQGCFSNIYERTNVNVYKCWLIANDFCVSKFLHIITNSHWMKARKLWMWMDLNRSKWNDKWLPFMVMFTIVYLNLQHMTVDVFLSLLVISYGSLIINHKHTTASAVTCEPWEPRGPSPSAWWWPSPWWGWPPPPSPAAGRRTSPRRQRTQTSPSGESSGPWWSSERESCVLISQINW